MAKFVDINHFRTSPDSVSTTTLLNLAGGEDAKVPQKSGKPRTINARLVLAANYLAESPNRKKDDVDALMGDGGRTFGGRIRWAHPLPPQEETNRRRSRSAQFMEWRMGPEESAIMRESNKTSAKRMMADPIRYDRSPRIRPPEGFS